MVKPAIAGGGEHGIGRGCNPTDSVSVATIGTAPVTEASDVLPEPTSRATEDRSERTEHARVTRSTVFRWRGVEVRCDEVDERRLGSRAASDGVQERCDGVGARCDGVEARCDGVEARCDGVEERRDGAGERSYGVSVRLDDQVGWKSEDASAATNVTGVLKADTIQERNGHWAVAWLLSDGRARTPGFRVPGTLWSRRLFDWSCGLMRHWGRLPVASR